MKKVIVIPVVIISLLVVGISVYFIMNNKEKSIDFEKNVASILTSIDKSNKEYLEEKNAEDEEWKVILETMEIEEDEAWNALIENTDLSNKAISEALAKMPIVGVGDSVFLSAIEELKKVFPNGYYDGKVSRSLSMALPILRDLKKSGKLTNYVVLGLATNGDYDEKKCVELMKILEDRTVYWINAVGADDPSFNKKFAKFAENYPNIRIVRWDNAAANHPEYFYKDGIHTKQPGVEAYVKVVSETIYGDQLKFNINSKEEMLRMHEEEISKRVAFYGNDLLINAFSFIDERFDDAIFNAKRNYRFEDLYNDVKSKIDNNTLEYKVVFMFDNNNRITKAEYERLVDLCKGHKIYIVNVSLDKLKLNDDINVIDFSNELKTNDYFDSKKVHLNTKGNKRLVELITSFIY